MLSLFHQKVKVCVIEAIWHEPGVFSATSTCIIRWWSRKVTIVGKVSWSLYEVNLSPCQQLLCKRPGSTPDMWKQGCRHNRAVCHIDSKMFSQISKYLLQPVEICWASEQFLFQNKPIVVKVVLGEP